MAKYKKINGSNDTKIRNKNCIWKCEYKLKANERKYIIDKIIGIKSSNEKVKWLSKGKKEKGK